MIAVAGRTGVALAALLGVLVQAGCAISTPEEDLNPYQLGRWGRSAGERLASRIDL